MEKYTRDFCIHPDTRILSLQERGGKGSLPSEAVDFSGRIKELRGDIIDAIRQLLHAHCVKEIRLPEEDYDPVWVIWFGKNGEPYECRVTGLRVTADSLTVLAEEKESGDEVQCHSPFELGAKNIDWLYEMYEAVWHVFVPLIARITARGLPKRPYAGRRLFTSVFQTSE